MSWRRGLRLVKRRPDFVEPNLRLNGFGQGRLGLLRGEVQGLVRGLHRLGKPPRLGVGGGQRRENLRSLAVGKLDGPLG